MELLNNKEYVKYCANHSIIFSQSVGSNGIVLGFEALESTNNGESFAHKNISDEAFLKAIDWINKHPNEMCNIVYNSNELNDIIERLIDIRDKLIEEEKYR